MYFEPGHAGILKVGYKISNNIIKSHFHKFNQATADICPQEKGNGENYGRIRSYPLPVLLPLVGNTGKGALHVSWFPSSELDASCHPLLGWWLTSFTQEMSQCGPLSISLSSVMSTLWTPVYNYTRLVIWMCMPIIVFNWTRHSN